MKQRILSLFLTLCMALTVCAAPVHAEGEPDYISVMFNGDPIGHEIMDEDNMVSRWSDTYAYIGDDGISMVDVTWLAQAIGAEVTTQGVGMTMRCGDVLLSSDGKTLTAVTTDAEGKQTSKQTPLLKPAEVRETNEYQSLVVQSVIPAPAKKNAVYYPIRSLSDALEMEIAFAPKGTHFSEESVVALFNADAMLDELAERAPSFYRLLDTKQVMQGAADSFFTVTFDYMPPAGEGEAIAASLNVTVNEQLKDALSTAAKVGIDIDLEQVTKALAESGFTENSFTLPKLEGITVDVIQDGGVLYLKTNLFEKLYAADKENPYFDLLANILDENQWMKINVEELIRQMLEEAGLDDEEMDIFPGDFSAFLSGEVTGTEFLKTMFDGMYQQIVQDGTGTDAIEAAKEIGIILDVYAAMDKYIKITDGENGDYTVQMDMTSDDFIDLLSSAMQNVFATMDNDAVVDADVSFEDEIAEMKARFKKWFRFDIHAKTMYTKDKIDSEAEATIGIDLPEDEGGIKAELHIKAGGTQKLNEKVTLPKLPERAIDLNAIIRMMQGMQ